MKNNTSLHKIATLTLLALTVLTVRASSAIVVLNFSGTYDTASPIAGDYNNPSYPNIFGLSTSTPSPYSYSITYDTSLDTNNQFVASGTNLNVNGFTKTTTRDWYAYSKSGIIATNLTVGSETWTVSNDFLTRNLGGSNAAELWFDTDISLFAPTRAWFDINKDINGVGRSNGDSYLVTGDIVVTGGETSHGGTFDILAVSSIGMYAEPNDIEVASLSFNIASSVPEPSRAMFLLIGLISLKLRRKRL
jgi:hypothetical protein